jgi:hypothetical protein
MYVFSSAGSYWGQRYLLLIRARERQAFFLSVLDLPFDIFDELGDFAAIGAGEDYCSDSGIVGEVVAAWCATTVGAGDLADVEVSWEVDLGFDHNGLWCS